MSDFDLEALDEADDEADDEDVLDSGVYYHLVCKNYTTVTGSDFYDLANPFVPCSSTYCVECEDFVGLNQVYWAETDESLAKYRRRVLREIPLQQRLLYWAATPALAALVAFIVGVFFVDWAVALLIVAPICSMVAHLSCRGYVLRWICRQEFRDSIW